MKNKCKEKIEVRKSDNNIATYKEKKNQTQNSLFLSSPVLII